MVAHGGKTRHWSLAAWLWLMLIWNVWLGLLYSLITIDYTMSPVWEGVMPFFAASALNIANVFCVIALLRWQGYGFWGLAVTCVLGLFLLWVTGDSISVLVVHSAGPLVVLWLLLRRGDADQAWRQLVPAAESHGRTYAIIVAGVIWVGWGVFSLHDAVALEFAGAKTIGRAVDWVAREEFGLGKPRLYVAVQFFTENGESLESDHLWTTWTTTSPQFAPGVGTVGMEIPIVYYPKSDPKAIAVVADRTSSEMWWTRFRESLVYVLVSLLVVPIVLYLAVEEGIAKLIGWLSRKVRRLVRPPLRS